VPQFMSECQSCGARHHSAARNADLIDPACPACGASSDPGRPSEPTRVARAHANARRPTPIGAAAPGHQRVAERFGTFMARGRPAAVRVRPESVVDA
jgi:hypothetical protein